MQVTTIQPNCSPASYKNSHCSLMRLTTSHITGESKGKESIKKMTMEQKLSPLLLAGFLVVLCAGPGHATRLLNDANGGMEVSFGTKAATAGAETEPLDPYLGDDYEAENEISHVEFEPELGSAAPYAAAAAPAPAATTTVTVGTSTAAAAPATEPVTVRAWNNGATAGTAAGSRSMKWWLPPSTMPSFPLFPNPGGMPAIPGLPLPVPGMPFHPIGGWAAPAPPAPSQPAPPATEAANTNGANDPNVNGEGVN